MICIILHFLEIAETCFLTKNLSKSYINIYLISKKRQNWFKKNFHNSGVVSRRKLPDFSLGKVFKLLFSGLRYTFPFEWSVFAWSTSLLLCKKVSVQNSRLVYRAFPFLKQVVSVIQFSNMLIVIELFYGTEKKSIIQFRHVHLIQLVFQGVQKLTLKLEWSKILSAFNCNWCDEYFDIFNFVKSLICVYSICCRCITGRILLM